MTTDPCKDVLERLRRAAQTASDIARQMAEAKSLRQAGNTEGRTDLYMWPTPEQTLEGKALATIERLSAARMQLREALEPFIEAAKIGVATYEAVKAANLRKSGLSSYDTVYISAGVYAAESRMSFADWERLAALSNTAENG